MTVTALDLLTKYLVSARMALDESIHIVRGFLRLYYVQNPGVAFGLFGGTQSAWKPYFLAGLAVVAVGVILVYSRHMPAERKLLQTALAVTLGGILGNFADRLTHGSVVDFIDVHIRDAFRWPTFNLADSAITIGIAMLVIDALRHPDRGISREQTDPVPQ
jgi:signal peptidase II